MRKSVISLINRFAVTCLLVFCIGCAGPAVVKTPPLAETAPSGDELSWWYVRFQSNWPEGRDPSWYVDPMLAREVIRPVLMQFEDQLVLWRFHRRAARDTRGHQFSFIFYASQDTATRINAVIQSSDRLAKLVAAGVIMRVRYDDPARLPRPGLGDTSDKNWSEPIQLTWPYFIMGVSRSWLELVNMYAEQDIDIDRPNTASALQVLYIEVNGKINRTWKNEGNHAYFHHLSALFGYQPLFVLEKRLSTF